MQTKTLKQESIWIRIASFSGPPSQTPFTETPLDRPLHRDPPGQTPSKRCPWTDPLHRDAPGQTPFTEMPLDRPPSQRCPLDRPPSQRCPWTDPPSQRLPWIDMPHQEGIWDQGQRPPEGTRDQAARQEVTSYREHPPHEQNDWHTLLKILPCPKNVS